jgi:hypothetical protein
LQCWFAIVIDFGTLWSIINDDFGEMATRYGFERE